MTRIAPNKTSSAVAACALTVGLGGCASTGPTQPDIESESGPTAEVQKAAATGSAPETSPPRNPAPGPCRKIHDKDGDGEPDKVTTIRWKDGHRISEVTDDYSTTVSPDKVVRWIWKDGRKARKLVDSHGTPKYRNPKPDGEPDEMTDWVYEEGRLSRRLTFRRNENYGGAGRFGKPYRVRKWSYDSSGTIVEKVELAYTARDRRLKEKHVWEFKEGRKVKKKSDVRGSGRSRMEPDGKFDHHTKWTWNGGHITRFKQTGRRTRVVRFDWQGGRKVRKRVWLGYNAKGKPREVWTWSYNRHGQKIRVERDGKLFLSGRKDGEADEVWTYEYDCSEAE